MTREEELAEIEAFMEKRALHGLVRSAARIFFRLIKSDSAGCTRMVANNLYLHVELVGFPDDEEEEIILAPDTFIPFYAAMFAAWIMPAITRRSLILKDGMLQYETADGKKKIPISTGASWMDPIKEWPAAIKKDRKKIAAPIQRAMDGFNALLKEPCTDLGLFQAYDYLRLIRLLYDNFLGLIEYAETANGLYRQRGEKEEAELCGHARALRDAAGMLMDLEKNCRDAMENIACRPGFKLKYHNRLTAPCDNPAAKEFGACRGTGVPFTTEKGMPVVDATGIMN